MKAKTITKALVDHHDEMRKLVKKIKKNSGKFILLKKHLDIHHELEEDLLLANLHPKTAIREESLESQEEHVVLNHALLGLADFPQDNERWMVKFKVLEEILDHHLEEEEKELFPEAEKLLNEKKLTELGARFEELKEVRLAAALETKTEKTKKAKK